jgi:hypothetical protein
VRFDRRESVKLVEELVFLGALASTKKEAVYS